jgi:hypothetical protein
MIFSLQKNSKIKVIILGWRDISDHVYKFAIDYKTTISCLCFLFCVLIFVIQCRLVKKKKRELSFVEKITSLK